MELIINMAREKIKKHHTPGEHIWAEPKEYPVSDEERKDLPNTLRKLQPNYYIISMTLPAKQTNTQPFLNYIEELKEKYELGIGKGDTEYGFRMPLAEKGERERNLIIFRRK